MRSVLAVEDGVSGPGCNRTPLRELIVDLGLGPETYVALGIASDAASRALLLDALERGEQKEATSAIWALARRPDGIQRVLGLVGDARPWVMPEVIDAIAEVSAPVTDEQLAAVARLGERT